MSSLYVKEKGNIIKLLIELSNHKSSSVQLEIANTLLEITANPNTIKIAIILYTNLLNEVKDNNCLIVILKSLFSLKLRFKELLEEHILSFVVLMSSKVSIESKQLAKQLVSELLVESNLISVFDKFSNELHKLRNSVSIQADCELKDIIIEIMFSSIKRYPLKALAYSTKLLESCLLTKADSDRVQNNTNIINSLFIVYSSDQHSNFLNCILTHFEDIKSIEILQTSLHLLAEFSSSTDQLVKVFDLIAKSIGEKLTKET